MSHTWQNQQTDGAPSQDSDQPGHPPRLIRVFAVRMKKPWVLSYPLKAHRRLWSDWTDVQADLSLRWAHTHFVGFVMMRPKFQAPLRQLNLQQKLPWQLEPQVQCRKTVWVISSTFQYSLRVFVPESFSVLFCLAQIVFRPIAASASTSDH